VKGRRVIRKTVPWTRLVDVARAAPLLKQHWDKLTASERHELQRLIRKSKGKPSNLTLVERATARRLVRKLELPRLGRDLAHVVRTGRARKR
jgi:hypothetical protein